MTTTTKNDNDDDSQNSEISARLQHTPAYVEALNIKQKYNFFQDYSHVVRLLIFNSVFFLLQDGNTALCHKKVSQKWTAIVIDNTYNTPNFQRICV